MGNVNSNPCRPQMKIHNLLGKNLRVSKERCVATRFEGYADAMFFGSRTVDKEEQIELIITKMTQDWNGSLRFGFTSHDPVAICNHPEGIPRFMCPDLIKRGGSFIETLNHIKLRVGDKIIFWVTPNGEIKFKVNDVLQRQQVTKLITRDVWPVVDVYGNAVEVSFRSLKDKFCPSDLSEPHYYRALRLCQFPVAVNPDSVELIKRGPDTFRRKNLQKAYAWNANPLKINTIWILFINDVDYLVSKDLSIAVLMDAPAGSISQLPDSINSFPRSTFISSVYARMYKGDELAICITDSGTILGAINGEAFAPIGTIGKANAYWIVADLNCDIAKMISLGVYQMTKYSLPKLPRGNFANRSPSLASIDSRFSSVDFTDQNTSVNPSVHPVSESYIKPLNEEAECVICLNTMPDSVFIPCGHVCCCKACADNLMNEHGNLTCPTCRKKIDGNIKIFF